MGHIFILSIISKNRSSNVIFKNTNIKFNYYMF
jgi:hypothetical protein